MCDVTDIAPHRQLDRSQIAQLAFRRFERSLDEFLGRGTPISKHELPHVSPSLPCWRNPTILERDWCLDGVWIFFFFKLILSPAVRRGCSLIRAHAWPTHSTS